MLPAASQAQAFALRRIPRKAHSTPCAIRATPQRRSFSRSAVYRDAQDPSGSTHAEASYEHALDALIAKHIPQVVSPQIPNHPADGLLDHHGTAAVKYEGQRLWRKDPLEKTRRHLPPATAWSLPVARSNMATSVEDTVWRLQQAVQTNDAPAAYGLLELLTTEFYRPDVADAISKLPRTTISAIFAALDPVNAAVKLDPTDGLNIPETLQEYGSVATALDEFGVRKVYTALFAHMEILVWILNLAQISLLPSEYCVLIRCAGATSDVRAVKRIWALMETDRTSPSELRSATLFNEFISARFLVRQLYCQYDQNRRRFRPRSVVFYRYTNPTSPTRKGGLETIRLDAARRRRFMYGVTPRKPVQDIHWTANSPFPLKRIWSSMLEQGIVPDSKLVNTWMQANGSAGKIKLIYEVIEKHFELTITNTRDHTRADFVFKKRKASRRKPLVAAPEFAETTIKTLASLGLVTLARRFMDAISSHHRWTFSRSFWSEFLSCTNMLAAPEARKEWKAFAVPGNTNHTVSSQDVIAIFETMTMAPNNVEPNFADHSCYVKSLIDVGRFEDARCEIQRGVAYYRNVVKDVSRSFLIRLHPSPPPSAHQAFLRAKALQHTSWYEIMTWCRMWIWQVSRQGPSADATIAEREIPNFVREFRDFMSWSVIYRTKTGLVQLKDKETRPKFRWQQKAVRSMPTTVLRRQSSQPIIDDEGYHLANPHGWAFYSRSRDIYSTLDQRTVRTRVQQRWEGFAPDALLVKGQRLGNGNYFEVCKYLVVNTMQW